MEGVRLSLKAYNRDDVLIRHHEYDLSRPYPDVEEPAYEMTFVNDSPDRWVETIYRTRNRPDGTGVYRWHREEKRVSESGDRLFSRRSYVYYVLPSPHRQETGWLLEGETFSHHIGEPINLSREYREGLLHGVSKRFSRNFEPPAKISEDVYHWGERHGISREWYGSGVLRSETPFYMGGAHGIQRRWHANGVLSWHTPWHHGQRHGVSESWNEDGVLTQEFHLQNNYVKLLRSYHSNGQISRETNYRGRWTGGTSGQSNRHGRHREWLADGRIREVAFYSNGSLCGTRRSYRYRNIDDISEDRVYTSDHGPCAPWAGDGPEEPDDLTSVDPPPDLEEDVGTPDDPNKSITGRVRCGDSGRPLSGVTVSAGSAGDATTEARGYYLFSVGNRDAVTLTFTLDGYRTHERSVLFSGSQRRIANVRLSKDADDAAVIDVVSKYGSVFLEGLPLHNEYLATVDWGASDPGSVVFNRNNAEHTVDGTDSGATMTFNMGSDFNAAFLPRANRLSVHAVNVAGDRSPHAFRLNPVVLPLPPWSLSLGGFSVERTGDDYTYELEASFPSEPMAIEISQESLGSVLWTGWGFVPVVGGQEFGIPPSQLNFEVAVSTEGAGSIGGNATMGFKVAGAEIETTLGVTGMVGYDPLGQGGLAFQGAELSGGLKGTVKREFGPVELIPHLAGAVNMPILGRPIGWFNRRAKIDASCSLGGELKFVLKASGEGVAFDRSEGTLSSGIELGLGGDIKRLKARVSGGGETRLTYQLPPNPDYLKTAEAEVTAKLELAIWSYETDFEATGTLSYPRAENASIQVQVPEAAGIPVARLLDTGFVDREPYHVFGGRSSPRAVQALNHDSERVAGPAGAQPMYAGETPFVSNIFPYAEPVLAASASGAALAYVAYDPTQPVTQGNELWVSFLEADEWNPPARVTHDSHNDYAPSLAYAADGKLVMVWERVRPDDFMGKSPEDLAPHLEIAWAVYDPAEQTWSAPQFLSDNDVLDFAPVLTASPDGALKVFWLHSPANQLIGDHDEPIRLLYAAWNGSGFDEPQWHPYEFRDAFDFSFAYDGQRAKVAWVQDDDGDLTTLEDQQPYYSFFDGETWGNPVGLLHDPEAPAGRPALLCTGPDQWEIFWQRGDELVRLADWETPAFESIRGDSGGFAFANYHLSHTADGGVLLVWQGDGEEHPDLFCRIYDMQQGVWSEDLRLTRQPGQESAIAANLHADGTLRLFFTRARSDESVTDLFTIEWLLGHQLSADPDRFDFTPQMPPLNAAMSMTAYVRNAGELALANLMADFYLGDPAEGGELIERVAVDPGLLPAGAAGHATLADWTVPHDIGLESVFVVFMSPDTPLRNDPAEHVVELRPVWVDLAVSHIEVGDPAYGGDIDVVANVSNHGNAIARDVAVHILIDGILSDMTRLPAILPGMTAQVGFTIARNAFNETRTTVGVEADPDRLLPDTDWENNLHEVVVNRVVGFSSMDDGMDDDWKLRHFGHLDVDPDEDADGDGFTNLQEFLAGTDPLDAGSFLALRTETLDIPGVTRLHWPARNGQRYRVEKSYDLENWMLDREYTATNDGMMSAIVFDDNHEGRAFYRVSVDPR